MQNVSDEIGQSAIAPAPEEGTRDTKTPRETDSPDDMSATPAPDEGTCDIQNDAGMDDRDATNDGDRDEATSHNALGRLSKPEEEAAADTATLVPPHKLILSKDHVLSEVKFFALLIFMSFLRATFNYMFILPNGFAPGGVGGISTILYNAILPSDPHLANTVFEPGLTTFIMNVPLLITAFFVLNKRFTLNTFCVIACYSGFTSLYSYTHFPQYLANGDTGLQIIAAMVGGSITGLCLGVMLRNNMSMGGTDIIGKIIHKHNPQAGANWWIMLCDCIIATSSCVLGILKLRGQNVSPTVALTNVLSPILFSFLSLAACSVIADVVQSGLQSSLVFTIITDKPNEIGEQIATKLHRGVTISKAVGYYTGVEHEVLVCVVSKKQINIVKNIVADADPMAFTYITKAREVAGKGFRSGS